MKISGFTIVRHGVRFDYPFLESIRSLLPIVDEYVINVGIGEDDTLKALQEFAVKEGNGKIKLFESPWPLNDPEKKRGGQILAEQTNLALEKCTGDWAIYLQADEILHEDDLGEIRKACEKFHSHSEIEGLLFKYVHFYGSFDVIRKGRGAYRREVRAVKTGRCKSIGDAQSFRRLDGTKPGVALIPARIFHYGWVRPPEVMKEKTEFMDQLYHGAGPGTGDNYRYKKILGLTRFRGTHPAVMKDRIQQKFWNWDLQNSPLEWTWKDGKKILLDFFEGLTGRRLFEYRSYCIREEIQAEEKTR
jgi:hypothetical protein